MWRPTRAEVDADLYSLVSELMTGNITVGPGGIIQMPLPDDLATLKTASTFLIIVNTQRDTVFQSSNLTGYEELLDPDSLGSVEVYVLLACKQQNGENYR